MVEGGPVGTFVGAAERERRGAGRRDPYRSPTTAMKNERVRVGFVLASAALVACRTPEPADDVVVPRDSAADRSVPSADAQTPGTDATAGTDAQTSMDSGVLPPTVTGAHRDNIPFLINPF